MPPPRRASCRPGWTGNQTLALGVNRGMTARKAAIGEVVAEILVPPEGPWADSFEDLFRRESLAMVRLAFLMVGSLPLAEEIVQDAFARVLERWDGIDQPVAYLRTSVVNGCKAAHR